MAEGVVESKTGAPAPVTPQGTLNKTIIVHLIIIHLVPALALYYYPMNRNGLYYFLAMYAWTGLGITVGYHRLWSHATYKAHWIWQAFWGVAGAGAMQGSILWWCRLHHLHHNFPDTEMDPYGPMHGFWYSHCAWMFYDTDRSEHLKRVDISDLKRSRLVMLQHKFFVPLSLFIAFGFPVLVFHDTWQALIYGGFLARVFTWHSTWCVNSLAHWLGTDEYSNGTSAKDHLLTALVTFGEGNHGFHHAFPFSYKNGVNWYDYDPTKRMIELGYYLGLCWDLTEANENEINKARYEAMNRKLAEFEHEIVWPDPSKKESVVSLQEYEGAAEKGRVLVAMNGFVYDVTEFAPRHPGGDRLLRSTGSKSQAYIMEQFAYRNTHSKAALNLLDTMLIGRLSQ